MDTTESAEFYSLSLSLELFLPYHNKAPKPSRAVVTSVGASLINRCVTRDDSDMSSNVPEETMNEIDSSERPVIIHEQANNLVSPFKHYNSSEKQTAFNYSTRLCC